MSERCPQCGSGDYGPFVPPDGTEIRLCLVCGYDSERGSTTKLCPGHCGTWIPEGILCCDPCWKRVPSRVPGFDGPWRSARARARRVRSSNFDWLRFEAASDAARDWLRNHPPRRPA